MTKAVDTRRQYAFEDKVLSGIPSINKQLAQSTLQRLINRVCKTIAYEYQPPVVVFGPGVRHGKQMLSWCNGPIIELAPGQRDKLTIYHELAHAIGHEDHDDEFRSCLFGLLYLFEGINCQTMWTGV